MVQAVTGSSPVSHPMNYIGRGWQYTAYDLGNGRVLKRFNTRWQAYLLMLRESFPYTEFPLWKFEKQYKERRGIAKESLAIIAATDLDRSFFGSPIQLNETDYEQDKVEPLSEYLAKISPEEGRHRIDEFVAFTQMLIGHRIIDRSFLIGKNYGVNRKGAIMLLDIGELYTDADRIKERIAVRPWDHPYVTDTLPVPLRGYFIEKMNEHIK